MTLFSILPFAAAVLSALLAVASVLRPKRSAATWCFFAGMWLFALDSLLAGLTLRATEVGNALRWLTWGLVVKSFFPAAWLLFSLTYSRGDRRATVASWRLLIAAFTLLPVALSLGFSRYLVQEVPLGTIDSVLLRAGPVAKWLNLILLVAFVLVLVNLEQTFRSAVGTMRWRIKFVVLGLAVIFGTQLYVSSEAVLYSSYDVAFSSVDSTGLLVGCLLLALAYLRTGFAEIEVYPSRALLRSSVTVLLVGAYLIIVGLLGEIAERVGGAESFQLQVLVVVLGMAGLAVLLLSDRVRQRVRVFVSRHFKPAQHDSVRIWTELSRRLSDVQDETAVATAAGRLIAEAFDVLSVTVWVMDSHGESLVAAASTSPAAGGVGGTHARRASKEVAAAVAAQAVPFNLESGREPWNEEWRRLNPTQFPDGGDRWCVPMRHGDHPVGALVLADRVNGAEFTVEDRELLRCIADQATSVLFNLRLADEVARGRELDAFRTMSTFFVHDLKNAAASLNLTLRNLPVHFDDPAFREDALRAIGSTARRIDEMLARLTALRQRPEFKPVECDLNELVTRALASVSDALLPIAPATELRSVPPVLADREQMVSVLTNLILNARDAVEPDGWIRVRTEQCGRRVVLSVADNGCGMTRAFIDESLFRPFQSTKKKGLGIGMFQARMIVEAHGGRIQVESEPGAGTIFTVSLPAKDTR